MKFSELFNNIENSIKSVKEGFIISDNDISIRADDKYHSIIGAYVEMDEEGEFYIVFDTNRKLLLGKK